MDDRMFRARLAAAAATVEAELDAILSFEPRPREPARPRRLLEAMRYSTLGGGKRLRPFLTVETARALGRTDRGPRRAGVAIECVHAYSLIHDDLPALDNDDLRRGRPTCHKVFGDAIAILAGDALQTQAYEVLSRLKCPAEQRVRIIEEIARGTGTRDGMIGGQVVDLEAQHTQPTAEMLDYIHRSKTAALIQTSSGDRTAPGSIGRFQPAKASSG